MLKVKQHGAFRDQLVACEYSQLLGVNFIDTFAPVVSDASFRILLIGMIVWNLKVKMIVVKTAFLHGDSKEEIFMATPPGMESHKDECLTLKKTIYGLSQNSRQIYVKLVEALKS